MNDDDAMSAANHVYKQSKVFTVLVLIGDPEVEVKGPVQVIGPLGGHYLIPAMSYNCDPILHETKVMKRKIQYLTACFLSSLHYM
jgi:hypothetical protein